MRRLLSLLAAALPAHAATVDLAWTNNTPGSTTIFYASSNALSSSNLATAFYRRDIGTVTNAHVTLALRRWWFAVTSLRDGLESGPSLLSIEPRTVWTAVTNTP